MNAFGLRVEVNTVVQGMKLPHFRREIVKEGISEAEFEGTLTNLEVVEAKLKTAPHEKLEALVARFDPQLTAHVDNFSKNSAEHVLPAFHEAQMLAGFVTTVMGKSGIC